MLCFVGLTFVLLGMFALFARDILVESIRSKANSNEHDLERDEIWESRATCSGLLAIALGIIIIIISLFTGTP